MPPFCKLALQHFFEMTTFFLRRLPLILLASLLIVAQSGCGGKNAPEQAEKVDANATALPEIKSITPFGGAAVGVAGNFTSSDFEGKVWVAMFGFTGCKGPCPRMTSRMADMHDTFAGEENVRFLFISVDSENDSLPALREYASEYTADTSRWYFLHMSREEVIEVSTTTFMLGNPDEPLDHSTRFALVDKKGTLRGYYDALEDEKMTQLQEDIRRLLSDTEHTIIE